MTARVFLVSILVVMGFQISFPAGRVMRFLASCQVLIQKVKFQNEDICYLDIYVVKLKILKDKDPMTQKCLVGHNPRLGDHTLCLQGMW